MAMSRYESQRMIRHPKILQKFYVYDPNVPDLLGGLRVLTDKDDKGGEKEGTRHVMAVTQQVQYWIDQGLIGTKPVGEIGDKAKKFLAQITRGRSEDNDTEPARVPRYDRRTMSGSPGYALSAPRRAKKKTAKKDKAPAAKSQPKTPAAPPPLKT